MFEIVGRVSAIETREREGKEPALDIFIQQPKATLRVMARPADLMQGPLEIDEKYRFTVRIMNNDRGKDFFVFLESYKPESNAGPAPVASPGAAGANGQGVAGASPASPVLKP